MDLLTLRRKDSQWILAIVVSWSILLVACVFAYVPGLSGPFIFDDFGSIAKLGSLGGVEDWVTFKAFVFGGDAGPTGRPLALLSFLIDANNWPTDSWPFKRTNLAIHLINGVLLGVLINMILRLLRFEKTNGLWISLLASGCWLLHPFLVSTTLYAVQRMAQLSTLFMFLGLISHLYWRSIVSASAVKAYAGMSLSVGIFMLLAMLSKENGILLPLLIGVLEITVIASQQPRLVSINRYWAVAFIVLPSIVISLYLGERILRDEFFEAVQPRDFSTYERLITEPRILVDYLRHWFVPELYTVGVFQDHFVKSTGLLAPITTLLSVLFHAAIIAGSILKRRQWPLLTFAALFFYASHLLESTVLNLELYFEHRNYLAAAFLFVPIIVFMQKKASRPLFFAATTGMLLVLTSFTRYSATIWADYSTLVEASARKAPSSARAQSQYSVNLFNEQRYEESLLVIDQAVQNNPDDKTLIMTQGIIRCELGILSAADFQQIAMVLSGNIYDYRAVDQYTKFTSLVADRRCPNVSLDALRALFSDMLSVPENADPGSLNYSQIRYFAGYVEVRARKPSTAVGEFEESLRARPGAAHAMMMAAVLATHNYFDEALYLSGKALTQLAEDPPGALQSSRVRKEDIMEFRANILAEMAAAEPTLESVDPRP